MRDRPGRKAGREYDGQGREPAVDESGREGRPDTLSQNRSREPLTSRLVCQSKAAQLNSLPTSLPPCASAMFRRGMQR